MSIKTILQIIILLFIGLIFYLIFFENGKTCGGLAAGLPERNCFPGLFYCQKPAPDPDLEGICQWVDFEQFLPSGRLED